MALDALVKPLLALPIFEGLSPLQLTEIVRGAERIVFRPGDAVIAENQPGDAAIIVIAGNCIRVDDNGDPAKKSPAEKIPEGAMIAELAMLVEIVHTTTVIAQGPVKALRLVRQRMAELMQEDPEIARHFSANITARLKLLANDLKAIDAETSSSTMPLQHAPRSATLATGAKAS